MKKTYIKVIEINGIPRVSIISVTNDKITGTLMPLELVNPVKLREILEDENTVVEDERSREILEEYVKQYA